MWWGGGGAGSTRMIWLGGVGWRPAGRQPLDEQAIRAARAAAISGRGAGTGSGGLVLLPAPGSGSAPGPGSVPVLGSAPGSGARPEAGAGPGGAVAVGFGSGHDLDEPQPGPAPAGVTDTRDRPGPGSRAWTMTADPGAAGLAAAGVLDRGRDAGGGWRSWPAAARRTGPAAAPPGSAPGSAERQVPRRRGRRRLDADRSGRRQPAWTWPWTAALRLPGTGARPRSGGLDHRIDLRAWIIAEATRVLSEQDARQVEDTTLAEDGPGSRPPASCWWRGWAGILVIHWARRGALEQAQKEPPIPALARRRRHRCLGRVRAAARRRARKLDQHLTERALNLRAAWGCRAPWTKLRARAYLDVLLGRCSSTGPARQPPGRENLRHPPAHPGLRPQRPAVRPARALAPSGLPPTPRSASAQRRPAPHRPRHRRLLARPPSAHRPTCRRIVRC